jgi:outer membrane protein assembly factor BamB
MIKKSLVLLMCLAAVHGVFATDDIQKEIKASGVKGGVVVYIGKADPERISSLLFNDSCLVQTLDTDAGRIASVRKSIQAKGLYGNVSVIGWDGRRLPYADNIVNLIIVDGQKSQVERKEIMRVLAPRGVAYVDGRKIVKPWPEDIDEWPHFLHGPDNNAVARDKKVGPSRHLQWTTGPLRSRDHDGLASMSAMTSSGGRMFYILDEGPTSIMHRPASWNLIARDAFNGLLLWKRKMPDWLSHLYYFRSGPAHLPRRLVSVEDKVYVTLGFHAPVSELDAADGRTLKTFSGTDKTEEIIVVKDLLFVVIGKPEIFEKFGHTITKGNIMTWDDKPEFRGEKKIMAFNRSTGKKLWDTGDRDLSRLAPLSMTAGEGMLFFLDNQKLYAVDQSTGQEKWSAPCATEGLFMQGYAPCVVYADNMIFVMKDRLMAFSAEDGRILWINEKDAYGTHAAADVFAINGKLWVSGEKGSLVKDAIQVLDMKTGKSIKPLSKKTYWPGLHHHRCYRNKATTEYLITSRSGLEFIGVNEDSRKFDRWVRGICQYGIMPANGLLYVPPHPCGCFSEIMFRGFHAFSHSSSMDKDLSNLNNEGSILHHKTIAKTPKRGKIKEKNAVDTDTSAASEALWAAPVYDTDKDSWPTYRHDISRSGSTPLVVSSKLKPLWTEALGEQLTSSTLKDNRFYVASKASCQLFCLDALTGKTIWAYLADGIIDSPPTLYQNLAIFGCRNGCVYALDSATGKMVWSFRAAPLDYQIVSHDRLESAWPVHGSVTVTGDVAYFAAGRSSAIDGGLFIYGLDARTGKVVHHKQLLVDKSQVEEKYTYMPDVFMSDGTSLVMRVTRFTPGLEFDTALKKHNTINTPSSMLDESWDHRNNWNLGGYEAAGNPLYNGPNKVRADRPFGKLIVFNKETAFSVQTPYTFLKQDKRRYPKAHTGQKHQKYLRYSKDDFPIGCRLYAQNNVVVNLGPPIKSVQPDKEVILTTKTHKWTKDIPLQVRAMVLTDKTLFAAGWKDVSDPDGTISEQLTACLQARSATDGSMLAEYDLPAQVVFDGMIAAHGSLYISLKNGTVMCLRGAK